MARRKALNVVGVALTAASLCWLVVLLHPSSGSEDVRVHSWLPTATAPH